MKRVKNKMKKVGVFAASAAVALSVLSPTALMAANQYTPVEGTSCTFNKYLIMDSGDTVPNATFAFTVAPGTAISADTSDNTVMQVLAGVGTPTIQNVTFSPSDETATSAGSNIDVARAASARQTGLTAANGVELESGEKYATKQATVDFSGITFNEPGIYRYIITETASATNAAAGIMHDNDTDRVLDVYVVHKDAVAAVTEAWIYDGTEYGTQAEAEAAAVAAGDTAEDVTHREAQAAQAEGLEIASYVMHTDESDVTINASMGSADVAAAGAALSDKTDGFTNEYNSKDLKIEKQVAGNQASHDKWFEFTVTATNVNDSDSYVVSIADDNNASTNDGNADATSGTTSATIAANQGKTNPTTVTGAQLKAGQKFYLQHGQSIVIRGLAPNVSYAVTENAEDYASTTLSGKTNSGVIGTVAGSNKMAEAGFLNTRDGVIPTGIFLAGGIGIAAVALGTSGLVFMGKRKKEKDEDEV